mmetsp:Transcript_15698/g.32487  ORF Transcript_15698/g.32487 Transcript_15698/m.32487 type:complete len:119 (+) Transcript_15698:693-1049(+)
MKMEDGDYLNLVLVCKASSRFGLKVEEKAFLCIKVKAHCGNYWSSAGNEVWIGTPVVTVLTFVVVKSIDSNAACQPSSFGLPLTNGDVESTKPYYKEDSLCYRCYPNNPSAEYVTPIG